MPRVVLALLSIVGFESCILVAYIERYLTSKFHVRSLFLHISLVLVTIIENKYWNVDKDVWLVRLITSICISGNLFFKLDCC